jgi:hypothetical protein
MSKLIVFFIFLLSACSVQKVEFPPYVVHPQKIQAELSLESYSWYLDEVKQVEAYTEAPAESLWLEALRWVWWENHKNQLELRDKDYKLTINIEAQQDAEGVRIVLKGQLFYKGALSGTYLFQETRSYHFHWYQWNRAKRRRMEHLDMMRALFWRLQQILPHYQNKLPSAHSA